MSLRWALLAGVWLVYGAFGLVAASMAPLVLTLEQDLQISHVQMGSVMGAWQFVYIFAAVPAGLLLDRIGARWALFIGTACIALSALYRSLADDYLSLLLAVMLFGIGGPIVSSGAPKVITRWFTGRDRGLAMGIYMTGPALGGVVGLTLTHPILLPLFDGDWRALFRLWAGVTLGAGVLWFIVASLPGARQDSREATSAGAADGVAAVGSKPRPAISILLAAPAVRVVLLMSVGVFLFSHGLNNWLPELLRSGGMTITTASYWAALPTVVGIAGSLLIPRLATPERRFRILLWLCLAAAVASGLLLVNQLSGDASSLIVGLLLQGIVRSSLMTVLILTLVELPGIGERYAGSASGLFFSAAEVGGVLGPLGLGVFYELTGSFDAGLCALALVALLLAAGSVRLKRLATVS